MVEEVPAAIQLLTCQRSPDVTTPVDAGRTDHTPPTNTNTTTPTPIAIQPPHAPHFPPSPSARGGVVSARGWG